MAAHKDIVTRLATLAARGALGVATKGGLHSHHLAIGGAGVAPGRLVYDTVTGQVVEVVSSTIAHVPVSLILEAQNNG